jgi:hypothetical protein
MKDLLSIQDLAAELQSRVDRKIDIVAPAKDLTVMPPVSDGITELMLNVGMKARGPINATAHRHLGQVTKIDKRYYDRMLAEPDGGLLLAGNVNHWLHQSNASHMVRTLDGQARAVLSDKYKRIDNEVIAQATLPALFNDPSIVPLQNVLTEDRMSMKFLNPGITISAPDGKGKLHPGIVISNSEVGGGRFKVEGFFYRDYCTNGCVFGKVDSGMSYGRTHIGSRLDAGILSASTVQKEQELMADVTRDIVGYVFSHEGCSEIERSLAETYEGERIDPVQAFNAVRVLGQDYGLLEQEREGVLRNLIEDGDFSRWGMLNAVTKVANTVEDNSRIHQLEHVGGKLIDLSQNQWTRVVNNINAMEMAA